MGNWLPVALKVAGVSGRLPLWMAWHIAWIMVATGRMVHPARYVDAMIAEAEEAAWDGIVPG